MAIACPKCKKKSPTVILVRHYPNPSNDRFRCLMCREDFKRVAAKPERPQQTFLDQLLGGNANHD